MCAKPLAVPWAIFNLIAHDNGGNVLAGPPEFQSSKMKALATQIIPYTS